MQVVFGLVAAVDLVEEVAVELEASATVATVAVVAVELVAVEHFFSSHLLELELELVIV